MRNGAEKQCLGPYYQKYNKRTWIGVVEVLL